MKRTKRFSQRQISRPVLWASVIALLLGAAAYPNLGALQSNQNQTLAPPIEAKAPITAMAIAPAIDAEGQIVNPTFAFTPNEPQITDIVTAKGVFDPDLADVKPGPLMAAINQLKATAKCRPPRIAFAISVALGTNLDYSWASALAKGRVEALQDYLKSHALEAGLEPDQYDKRITSEITPPKTGDAVVLNFAKFNDQDRDPPQIKLTSKPDAGTCVSPGEQIEVTIKASERYEDGHKSWPSGVQMIQLKANGVVVEPTGFWRTPQPCERQTLTVTYKVPSPAPSVVHLKAIVDDAANPTHEDSKSLDFPTGTQCKNVMPANCKVKGYAKLGFIDAAPLLGSFDPQSPNRDMISCNFRWYICGKEYIKTKVVKNAPGACKSFFTEAEASLPKEAYCCDCYPKCAAQRRPNK